MDIGVVTEIKQHERRVAMDTGAVREATLRGHRVFVQAGAGDGAGIGDDRFRAAGAEILPTAAEVFDAATLLVHVKEPQPSEVAMLRPDHILFTYLHLAAYPTVADGLLSSGCTAIAYETVELPDGRLPLLAPMSVIAGRLAVQAGAHHLEAPHLGKGVLLAGYPGVPGAMVVVLGCGSVGTAAIDVAVGMGAHVVAIDLDDQKLTAVEERFPEVITVHSNREAIERWVHPADLVIGSVLVAGGRAPVVVTADDIAAMQKGSVVVDVAIDQGGCIATSHETTHADPVYLVDDVVHYAVGNMPGAVPRTSTHALSNATSGYVLALADGIPSALARRPELLGGVEVTAGVLTSAPVGAALGRPWSDAIAALAL